MGKKKKRGGGKNKSSSENVPEVESVLENGAANTQADQEKEEQETKYTVTDIMERVEQYLEKFEYDMAFRFCKKALELEPENTQVLVGAGNVCAEIGDIENAKEYFKEAVKLEPDNGHIKYLYLGQLSEGKEAVGFYETAVTLVKKEIKYQKNNVQNENSDDSKKLLSDKDISSVYCSLAEIYMTDLCMDDDAESICEKYCKLAMEVDKNSLEAVVSMCNLLLSQNNMESAKNVTEQAFELWSSISKDQAEENIPEAMSYEARVTLVKILIEVENYDKVSHIVDQLIEENEDDIRIWYYLGLAKSLMKDTDNPRFYLEKALELFNKTGHEDEDMFAHINELLESCPEEEDCMDTIQEDSEDEIESDEEGENEINNSMDVE